ncbi:MULTISPECIES: tetratricopeptide repeat protein [unclassified Bacillus cereus group]|uniref:response regulator aspartate phosphatase n=1 Tax=unclassified Bacillus cereus group TaxID=2750818 RepID=UPI001F5971E1|nr:MULTISPECIES: tetratricopeptide repeat protein [unclassified Bacillus cereus group]
MGVSVKGNEVIIQLLNDWYVEIRGRRIENAHCLKTEIDTKIQNIEDKNLLLYYSLLNFRYQYVIDNVGVSKNSFDKIESFAPPTDNRLAYYYHFFKAIHSSTIGNYNVAKEHFEKAETLLEHISDELEKAEFHYKLGAFHYDIYQGLLSVKQVTKARELFSQHIDCEINVAFCDNLLGLACTHLREWELAEEYFTKAMNTFQKINEEQFILMVRQNLGLMYASQNLSPLAIRYLAEVNEKMPKNYKSMFIEAKEHSKLGEVDEASRLIDKGLEISNQLHHEEYKYRFKILKAMNTKISGEELEKIVLEGITYFKEESLWEYVQEYTEIVALQYHREGNSEKSSYYFYLSYEAKNEVFKKEALK